MARIDWLGRAIAVKDVVTVQLTGTYSAGEKITFTLNGKALILTIGTGQNALTAILDDLLAMWNGTALTGTESRNGIGSDYPEFDEITATEDGTDTLTLTHNTAGVPFFAYITVAEDSGTGGVTVTNSQVATGPEFADNVNNYSGGSLPSASDSLFFGAAQFGPKYGLDALDGVTSITLIDIDLDQMRYEIGLPIINTSGGYTEYRERYLQFDGATLCRVRGTTLANVGLIRLDFLATEFILTGEQTGSSTESGMPAVNIIGTAATNSVEISGGDYGVCSAPSEVATVKTLIVNNGNFTAGPGATLNGSGSTFVGRGGSCRFHSSLLTATIDGGIGTINGTGTIATLTVRREATWNQNSSGTVTAGNVEGILDLTGDADIKTFTDLTLGVGGTIRGKRRLVVTNNMQTDADVDTLTAS